MTDDIDRLLSGGAKSAKFTDPGDSITGLITDIAVRQATEYGTGKPQTFDNGDPKEQIVVTIKAEGITPDDDEDDLHRSVYIKGWGPQRRAFIESVRASHKPEVGDRFTATLVRMEPSKSGGFPAKVFEYRITALEKIADAQAWAPAAEVSDARAQAEKMLWMGKFSDLQVAAATGLPVDEVRSISGTIPF